MTELPPVPTLSADEYLKTVVTYLKRSWQVPVAVALVMIANDYLLGLYGALEAVKAVEGSKESVKDPLAPLLHLMRGDFLLGSLISVYLISIYSFVAIKHPRGAITAKDFLPQVAFWRLMYAQLRMLIYILPYLLAIMILIFLIMVVVIALSGEGSATDLHGTKAFANILIWLTFAPLFGRLILVGPMVLAGGRHVVRRSWKLTSGLTWPLTALAILSGVPSCLSGIVRELGSGWPVHANEALASALLVFSTTLWGLLCAYGYDKFAGRIAALPDKAKA